VPHAPSRDEFIALARAALSGAAGGAVVIPVGIRLMGDQLTPVLAYRRLVVGDARTAPSFLLESVEGGDRVGRYSLMGAQPRIEVIARGAEVTVRDRRGGTEARTASREADPLGAMRRLLEGVRLVMPGEAAARRMPKCLLGGWFGYASYDTVRYAEPGKLDWAQAPRDDRGLPDLQFGYYDRVVVFDHVETLVHVVRLVEVRSGDDAGARYDAALAEIDSTRRALQTHSKPLASGDFEMAPGAADSSSVRSNMTRAQHREMVERAKEYIRAGDIFQVVLGQRFERVSDSDPFDVYRALRAVNPSPYMGYLQGEGCILVASSPEILCRVERGASGFVVTNRPLAGTRKRGATDDEDRALERELLADAKERAEHIMLVDLGRNDVGRVAQRASVTLPALMEIERYSHVMHISSTVKGVLGEGLDCWDALRAALPVGTISGAPKVRAMQIIDELEPVRRGPYGGGFGGVGLDGSMDIALALRTMVVPTALQRGEEWTYHIQAAGGIVADSDPEAEFAETVNKASALLRAIEVAERAFGEA